MLWGVRWFAMPFADKTRSPVAGDYADHRLGPYKVGEVENLMNALLEVGTSPSRFEPRTGDPGLHWEFVRGQCRG
jgi:hypothetical protein